MAVSLACWSRNEMMCSVVRSGLSGEGGEMVIIEVEGSRLWCRIWVWTTNWWGVRRYSYVVGFSNWRNRKMEWLL